MKRYHKKEVLKLLLQESTEKKIAKIIFEEDWKKVCLYYISSKVYTLQYVLNGKFFTQRIIIVCQLLY